MRIIIQRCTNANVVVDNKTISSINSGYVLLVGFETNDTKEIVNKVLDKLVKLRICEDENGKLNLNICQTDGEILSISQFTLYADLKKGNRPSFTNSLQPDKAEELYNYFNSELLKYVPQTKTGSFGSYMKVSLINDGPVTVILDSKDLNI